MKKVYLVLLKNDYFLFFSKKPVKKGNYTKEVRLFEVDKKGTCESLLEWKDNEYNLSSIKEVSDWE